MRFLLLIGSIALCTARPFEYLYNKDVVTEISVRAMHRPEKATGNGGRTGREWFQRNLEPSVRCPLDVRIGAVGDGGDGPTRRRLLFYPYTNSFFPVA